MKKRTLMKRVCVFAMLCVLTMTMFMEPTFAATEPQKYKIDDGGTITSVSGARKTAIDKMLSFSIGEWKLDKPLTYCYTSNDSINTLQAGTYYGVPYTQLNREHSYLGNIAETGVRYGENRIVKGIEYATLQGTDCSSSIDIAWRMATGEVNDSKFMKRKKKDGSYELYRTKNMFNDGLVAKKLDGEDNYLKLVGSYGACYTDPDLNKKRTDATETKTIVNLLSEKTNYTQGTPGKDVYNDIFSKIYAAMKPGDALLTRGVSGTSGHVRLVTGVMIRYTTKVIDGETWTVVDPDESKVLCIEQAGFRKGDRNWKTSWIPNKDYLDEFDGIYTFKQLAGIKPSPVVNPSETVDLRYKRYLPIKLIAFND